MCIYSLLFMRFAWAINPRNYLLFACHLSNEAVQLNQMRRVLSVQDWDKVSKVCLCVLGLDHGQCLTAASNDVAVCRA
jgi:hypothetical protein